MNSHKSTCLTFLSFRNMNSLTNTAHINAGPVNHSALFHFARAVNSSSNIQRDRNSWRGNMCFLGCFICECSPWEVTVMWQFWTRVFLRISAILRGMLSPGYDGLRFNTEFHHMLPQCITYSKFLITFHLTLKHIIHVFLFPFPFYSIIHQTTYISICLYISVYPHISYIYSRCYSQPVPPRKIKSLITLTS